MFGVWQRIIMIMSRKAMQSDAPQPASEAQYMPDA